MLSMQRTMRLREGGVSNPGCCLLLNFFLLFGVSYVLGVVFLHYSASMVRNLKASLHTIIVSTFQTNRNSTQSGANQSTECKHLHSSCPREPLEDTGQHQLSIFKMFLYIYSATNTSVMNVGVYPNRTAISAAF